METTETAQLRQEIAFRGRILEALLASNEELREKCAHLSSFIQSKMELYSSSEREAITKQLVYSASDKCATSNELLYSTSGLGVTLNDSINSTTDKRVIPNDLNHSTSDLGATLNESNHSTTEEGGALNGSVEHDTEKGSGTNGAPEPLPEKFAQKSKVVYLLSSSLRQYLQDKGRESAMEAAAFVMLHIYNDGSGSYEALGEATGQSQGGLAKMLMRLKKEGLIQRTAFQKYALTETALDLLKQAWAKTPK